MENQLPFSTEDLEILALPEREAMKNVRILSGNNNFSPRGRDSSLIDIGLALIGIKL
jgi:hypothetical protein